MSFEISKELSQKIKLFETWVESKLSYENQPGVSVGVIYDQELVWSRGFGYADKEKGIAASPDTIYRIASNTKTFTATAILQLRDQNKLRLDDVIWDYLPDMYLSKSEYEDAPIRIWNLLTHTSGLPRESASPYWSTAEFPSYKELKELLKTQNQIYPTALRWKYSNLAVSLAGMIVEQVSGISYEDYIQTNILQPLGMNNTFVHTIDKENPLLAKAYGRKMPDGSRAERPFGDCKGITPAANMSSTVNDLSKFVSMQFSGKTHDGTQIMSLRTLREMHTLHWIDERWKSGWGWGFMINRVKNRTLVGHGGSLMGYRTGMLFDPKTKTGTVVMTNFDDGVPMEYVEKIFDWIVPEIEKTVAKTQKKPKQAFSLEKYQSKFSSPWGDVETIMLGEKLIVISPRDPNPLQDVMELRPVGENEFIIETDIGVSSPGEKAFFEFDENGKPVRLWLADSFFDVVDKW